MGKLNGRHLRFNTAHHLVDLLKCTAKILDAEELSQGNVHLIEGYERGELFSSSILK